MLTKKLIYDIITGRVTWEEFQALELTKEDRKLLYDSILAAYKVVDIYATKDAFPKVGHIKKFYIDLSTDITYIWKNDHYTPIQGKGGGLINIVDNLDSYDANSSLSANQGRVLKSIINEFKQQTLTNFEIITNNIIELQENILEATDEEVINIINN